MELPNLPNDFSSFVSYLNQHQTQSDVLKAVQPFKEYESTLRRIYAQQPQASQVQREHIVPVFANEQLITRARNLEAETVSDKEKYILALSDSQRLKDGSSATVKSIKEFKTNFNLFSEQSLVDLDWSNVVAAGSSVVTPLLPVNEPHNESKRALRSYYHEQLAPASDVDLFIYGLDEEQAIEKVKQIETSIRDSVLAETTTIRTKNAITIVSEYPTRHVQIVLRLYKNITEILTGFDVDCSCVAYDGKQVWASPRALAAFATQQNSIDLTRRSPSYENRLSKYSRRGFEVYWPLIDRKRVDPTIYERAFNRVVGLARLLVLEKLPHPSDRDTYLDKRRRERGRPELPWQARYRHALPGNVKDAQPDDVPDWLEEDDISDYHTFTIPYGPKFNAKRIEKLLFKQDLLLNAEWNKSKDRETDLHRHPAFFGTVDDVISDCCGFCPEPKTDEDLKYFEEESKRYISGELKFMKDDPGRQAIGSFNPLTDDDWTDMSYLGSSIKLCQAIADNDLEAVKDWFGEEGADVNRRDHAGRTPLQLACMVSTPEIVNELIEHGARIVSRIYNGMTALHMAAHRGNAQIVKLLLDRSELNEEEEDRKEEARKASRRAAFTKPAEDVEMTQADDNSEEREAEEDQEDDDDIDMIDEDEGNDDVTMKSEGSLVKVEKEKEEDNDDDPDFYDIDVLAWDSPLSALHLAIIGGHIAVIEMLVTKYGADVMLPVKVKQQYGEPRAILNLMLPLQLPFKKAHETVRTLLSNGANPAQADSSQHSVIHYLVSEMKLPILDLVNENHSDVVKKVINHTLIEGWQHEPTFSNPLTTAIKSVSPEVVRKVLQLGAEPSVKFEQFANAYSRKFEHADQDPDQMKKLFLTSTNQPIVQAAKVEELVEVVVEMLDAGVDVNAIDKEAQRLVQSFGNGYQNTDPSSLLDIARKNIKELRGYKCGKVPLPKKPDALPEFEGTIDASYKSWVLQKNYSQAESLHKEQMEKYQKEMEEAKPKVVKGEKEKQEAIASLADKWESLEKKMIEMGAKPFKELYPDVEVPDRSDHHNNFYRYNHGTDQNKQKPFENKVSFRVSDLTDSKKDRYVELFEAVYAGDENSVKKICLGADALKIAVQDDAGYNPFSLAVVRGHYDLSRTVLDIAAAQYEPKEEEAKTYRYSIRRPEDEYDNDDEEDKSEDDDMTFYKELVDEAHTIDDIRNLSEQVKSRVSPAKLIKQRCQLWRSVDTDEKTAKQIFGPGEPERYFYIYNQDEHHPWGWFNEMYDRENTRHSWTLTRLAIVNNDLEMLEFLLGLRKDLDYRKDDDGSSLVRLQPGRDSIELALRLGHTDLIGEMIRQTGAMMPLAVLAKKSGIELEEKPQYYQGLSVYGKKREDWAAQDRGERVPSDTENSGSPLLAAIISGNMKTVEYFLSDTPLRCYEEFTKTFKHDKRIMLLAKAEGGVERALHSWMNTRTYLALHMAVMANENVSEQLLEFLIKRMPQYIQSKSSADETPLHLAFRLMNYKAAKKLIEAGADQTTRDHYRRNLLHTIYLNRHDLYDSNSLKELVGMLDPELIPRLVLQRCKGDGAESRTPLMDFLFRQCRSLDGKENLIDLMLEYSSGKDLEVMDGAGEYPLHALLRSTDSNGNLNDNIPMAVIKHIATRRPELLYKENATGMTPIEIAQNYLLRQILNNPPNVRQSRSSRVIERQPSQFIASPPSPNAPTGPVANFKQMCTILHEIADAHPSPRGLVSLIDANETARRLAEQQQRQNADLKRREAQGLKSYGTRAYRGYYDNNYDQASKGDEVQWWEPRMNALRKALPIPTSGFFGVGRKQLKSRRVRRQY